MILKNDKVNRQLTMSNGQRTMMNLFAYCLLSIALLIQGCYTFKDIGSIPKEVKTFRVTYIENRARYINPQLSPQLTEKLKQKIVNQTRLTGVQTEEAHYDIGGQVTGYNVTTSGISNQQAAV